MMDVIMLNKINVPCNQPYYKEPIQHLYIILHLWHFIDDIGSVRSFSFDNTM